MTQISSMSSFAEIMYHAAQMNRYILSLFGKKDKVELSDEMRMEGRRGEGKGDEKRGDMEVMLNFPIDNLEKILYTMNN